MLGLQLEPKLFPGIFLGFSRLGRRLVKLVKASLVLGHRLPLLPQHHLVHTV